MSRSFQVKEIFLTIQGEGVFAGRPAVFCRFAGCNLWSGLEQDRSGALCNFCDTDFVGTDGPGGDVYLSERDLVERIVMAWPATRQSNPFVVFTGGEPMLQLNRKIVERCHRHGFEVAVETNGTRQVPEDVDWVTVSPKLENRLVQDHGDELKLIYPGVLDPAALLDLDFRHFLLQPMAGDNYQDNLDQTVRYCLRNPRWRLSLQIHKYLGLP